MRPAWPGSRSWMKYAFSTRRVASRNSRSPWRLQNCAQRLDVRHADRLAARHVHGGREAHVGDVAGALLADQALELREVHVTLERRAVGRVVRCVHDHVDEDAARQFLVQARGGEVHVAGHVLPLADRDLADQVFRAAALVGRHDVLVTVVRLDRRLEAVEVAAAGVGLVAEHHAGPLAVAHGAGAAVGQQVDVDVVGAQQEGVVARVGQRALAVLAPRHAQRLDHLDLPRLGPGPPPGLLAHGQVLLVGHGRAPKVSGLQDVQVEQVPGPAHIRISRCNLHILQT